MVDSKRRYELNSKLTNIVANLRNLCAYFSLYSVPRDLDKHTTITIDNQTFDIEADDLEVISELGKFILLLIASKQQHYHHH
jgi:hypothetical protein